MSGKVIQFPVVRKGEKPDMAPSLEGFRWWAVVDYPSGESKPLVFDEFDQLGEFMEKGPDWSGCTIRIAHYEKALEDPTPTPSRLERAPHTPGTSNEGNV